MVASSISIAIWRLSFSFGQHALARAVRVEPGDEGLLGRSEFRDRIRLAAGMGRGGGRPLSQVLVYFAHSGPLVLQLQPPAPLRPLDPQAVM